MNMKGWLDWIYERVSNYNLFISEEEHYPADENEERDDPRTILQYQKYTTRLYIILLFGRQTPRLSLFLYRDQFGVV